MWKIGNVEIANEVVSAPLAGISDKAFRLIAKEFGCGLVYTEMISDKALLYKNKKTYQLMDLQGEEQPVNVQLFGSEAEDLGEAAKIIEDHGAVLIDFNMGCPAPKIVKNGEGSALMRDPEKAIKDLETIVKSVKIPVTVKMRKGFSPEQVNVVELAKMAEKVGAKAIAVHGRTRDQFYSGKADWDIIREVVESVRIPVIGNGDIFRPEDGQRMIDYTGCTAVMIGRGAFGNPWLYRQNIAYMAGREVVFPDIEEKIRMAFKHLELIVDFKGEGIGVKEMRKQIAWYIKGAREAAFYKEKINHATAKVEVIAILLEFLEKQGKTGEGVE